MIILLLRVNHLPAASNLSSNTGRAVSMLSRLEKGKAFATEHQASPSTTSARWCRMRRRISSLATSKEAATQ